jgi:hypothetical protein
VSFTNDPSSVPHTPATTNAGRGYTIAAFICAAVALLFLPIVFGPAGIVLGIIGNRKGDPLGRWAAITAAVLMIAGMVIGYLIIASD